MGLTKSELYVKSFFEKIGFDVETIQQAQPERRADFRVKDDRDSYVVEVKSKDEDEAFASRMKSGRVASRKEYLGRVDTVSAQIRDGVDQIRKTPKNPNEFSVLVLVAADDEPDSQAQQFEGTLYGISNILDLDDPKREYVPCFYFTFNEFFNLPDIEAAIIFWGDRGRMCINGFSARGDYFRRSTLFKFFADNKVMMDPIELEKMGAVYIADCNLDRREERLMEQFIKEKYKLPGRVISLNFTHHSAAMFVPDQKATNPAGS